MSKANDPGPAVVSRVTANPLVLFLIISHVLLSNGTPVNGSGVVLLFLFVFLAADVRTEELV